MSRSMPLLYVACVCVSLAGCAASTGVVAIGKDKYMVSHRDNGPMASLGALKAQAYKDASEFCAAKGQALQVASTQDVPRSFGQFPEAAVEFTCVAATDAAASKPQ